VTGQPPGGGEGRREIAAFFGWSRPAPAWAQQTPVPWWKSLSQPRRTSGAAQADEPPVVLPPVPAAPPAEPGPAVTHWEPGAVLGIPTPFGAYEPGPYGSWADLMARPVRPRAPRTGEQAADRRFRVACLLLMVTTVLAGVGLLALAQVVEHLP
jgi:hypothetical protein